MVEVPVELRIDAELRRALKLAGFRVEDQGLVVRALRGAVALARGQVEVKAFFRTVVKLALAGERIEHIRISTDLGFAFALASGGVPVLVASAADWNTLARATL